MSRKRSISDKVDTIRMQVLLRRDEAPELFAALEKISNKFVRRSRMIGLANMGLAVNRGSAQVLVGASQPAANGQFEAPAAPASSEPVGDDLLAAFGAVDSLGLGG